MILPAVFEFKIPNLMDNVVAQNLHYLFYLKSMTTSTRDFAVRTTFVVLAILSIVLVCVSLGFGFYDSELFKNYSFALITLGVSFWTPSILKLRKAVEKDDLLTRTKKFDVEAPMTVSTIVAPDPPSGEEVMIEVPDEVVPTV
jgi:hypothetical protein